MRKNKSVKWSLARVGVFGIMLVFATALVGKVIFSNLPLDGHLRVLAIPGEPSPFFGGFRPESRIVVVPGKYVELRDEPIYFSMAVPTFFRTVTVRLEYQNLGQPVIELGARTSLDKWVFILKPIEADTRALDGLDQRDSFLAELETEPAPQKTSDGWRVSETTFDLGSLAVDANGDLQMVVSLPGMKNTSDPVRIRNVQIEYVRPPLSLGNIINALRNRISL